MTLLVLGILLAVAGIGWALYCLNQKIDDMDYKLTQINAKLDTDGIKSDGRFIEGNFVNGKDDPDDEAA